MDPRGVATPNGAYRTPGRAALAARIPFPSWRTLLAPLARAAGYVALVVVAIAAFNALGPALLETAGDVRMIPAVDQMQSALSLALLASPILLVVLIVRRVRPSWGGMRRWTKLVYVASLLVLQSGVVVAAEAAIFTDRGGLHLFGPSHLRSTLSPDLRTAHVYSPGGLRCGYDVFVSGPFSLTGKRVYEISRSTCLEPTPRVRWNPDGTVVLVDAAGQPLQSQPSPSFSFGGGC